MIVFPNAKINIGLYVTEKRADGYHNLISCFVPIPWEESLEVIQAEKLSFHSTGISIPGASEANLCLQAFNILAQDFDLSPVHMHLHKTLPIGAGLGGGSADATFTLKALNDIFNLGLSDDSLEAYASRLGSDCPFFVKNEAVMASGTGNVFSPVRLDLQGYYIVLVNPNIHVSTKDAYAGLKPKPCSIDLEGVLSTTTPREWRDVVENDFEKTVFEKQPVLGEIKDALYAQGAEYASMSGSGATLYGIFREEPHVDGVFPSGYQVKKFKL